MSHVNRNCWTNQNVHAHWHRHWYIAGKHGAESCNNPHWCHFIRFLQRKTFAETSSFKLNIFLKSIFETFLKTQNHNGLLVTHKMLKFFLEWTLSVHVYLFILVVLMTISTRHRNPKNIWSSPFTGGGRVKWKINQCRLSHPELKEGQNNSTFSPL